MAHLDNWEAQGIPGVSVEMVRESIRRHFWAWYAEHRNDVLFRVLFWTFRVKDLKWLFEELFGTRG